MAKQREKLHGLTADSARRIRRVCERVEGTPPGRVFGDASGGRFWNPGVARAKVTTAISAGTFGNPSYDGEVQIYHKNSAGDWLVSGDPVEVFNQFGGGGIDVGASVLIAWISGDWFVVAADCPPEPGGGGS